MQQRRGYKPCLQLPVAAAGVAVGADAAALQLPAGGGLRLFWKAFLGSVGPAGQLPHSTAIPLLPPEQQSLPIMQHACHMPNFAPAYRYAHSFAAAPEGCCLAHDNSHHKID
jgi:hypothetical protein